MSSSFVTSALTKIASPPCSLMAFTVTIPASSERSTTTTLAAFSESFKEAALPIPPPPPVTIATLSVKSNFCIVLSPCIYPFCTLEKACEVHFDSNMKIRRLSTILP